MDMRGFGESSWSPSKAYAVSDFADDCVALMDHLGWRRVILMGHSMGGRNATWCAAENSDRIEALVLVDYSLQNAPQGSKRVVTTVAGAPERFASVNEAMKYFGADGGVPAVRTRYEAYLNQVDGGYIVKRDNWRASNARPWCSGARGRTCLPPRPRKG